MFKRVGGANVIMEPAGMVPPLICRLIATVALCGAALPTCAAEAYQVGTISGLISGGYDGDTTVGALLRHGGFGLGTFNGVDGEMMVLDGRVFRGMVDGRARRVPLNERTPFAVVTAFRPRGSMRVIAGQSLPQLQAALDALP
jgi:acetolactate decarboxylase